VPKELPLSRISNIAMKGNDLSDDIRAIACKNFISDDDFVNTKEFSDFLWRRSEYEKILKEEMARSPQETPDRVSIRILTQMKEVKDISPDQGRQMIRDSGVLLLPEWDIASAIVLDTVRRQDKHIFSTEEEAEAALTSAKFNPKWETLAIWALARNTNKPLVAEPDRDFKGGLIIKRVSENLAEEASDQVVEVAKFSKVPTSTLQKKYDDVLKEYMGMLPEYNKLKEMEIQWQQQASTSSSSQVALMVRDPSFIFSDLPSSSSKSILEKENEELR